MRWVGFVSVFLLLIAANSARANEDMWSLHFSLGGQGVGAGGFLELALSDTGRLMLGQGETLDVLGFIGGDSDRRQSTYLNYVYLSPGTHSRLELAIGPAYITRDYDRLFSDNRDFEARAWAVTGAFGVRNSVSESDWAWRLGISPIVLFDQSEREVYGKDVLWRAYFSVGLQF